jgi:hypothetical protein
MVGVGGIWSGGWEYERVGHGWNSIVRVLFEFPTKEGTRRRRCLYLISMIAMAWSCCRKLEIPNWQADEKDAAKKHELQKKVAKTGGRGNGGETVAGSHKTVRTPRQCLRIMVVGFDMNLKSPRADLFR